MAGCGQAWAELMPVRDGGQPGLALSHTNSSSKAPPERLTKQRPVGKVNLFGFYFFLTITIFF